MLEIGYGIVLVVCAFYIHYLHNELAAADERRDSMAQILVALVTGKMDLSDIQVVDITGEDDEDE